MADVIAPRCIRLALAVVLGLSLVAVVGCSGARNSQDQSSSLSPSMVSPSVVSTAGVDATGTTTQGTQAASSTSATPTASAEATTPPAVQVKDLSPAQQAWFATAVGRYIDPDGAYGFQCVDVVDDYCIMLWGDWIGTVGPVSYAYQLFDRASARYFTKIARDPNNPNLIPQAGDIVIWGSDKPDSNGAGHCAVVVSADKTAMQVMEQDHNEIDGLADLPCIQNTQSYDYVTGWLRPIGI